MDEANCIFCKIIAGAVPSFRLAEDAASFAMLDINPVNPGHALVLSKHHAATLAASRDGDLAAAIATARRIAAAIETVLKPDGINLLQANGPGAAQSVAHFHLHVIPRILGDDLRMNWAQRPGDRTALAAMAERLRAAL
jgi:histidine triad (HIT) family protein